MSTIRCIYTKEPNFPATDQHPNAVRYHVGGKVVDAIGGVPTQAEIDAVLNPPAQARPITADDLAAVLKAKGVLTDADLVAAKQ